MPSCDGMALDPGRDRVSEKKRDEGADWTAEESNKLEANEEPSRSSLDTGVTDCAIRELEGRARPRMPLNSCSRGSDSTLVAAAAYASTMWTVKDWRWSTKCLVVDGVPSNVDLIPVYGAAHVTGEVLDRKVRLGSDT